MTTSPKKQKNEHQDVIDQLIDQNDQLRKEISNLRKSFKPSIPTTEKPSQESSLCPIIQPPNDQHPNQVQQQSNEQFPEGSVLNKVSQVQETSAQQNEIQIPINSQVQKLSLAQFGMELLKQKFKDQKSRIQAVAFLQAAADHGDVEASWRFSACLFYGIGIKKNYDFAIMYAEIAMKAGSLDGLFWYSIILKPAQKGLIYLQEAIDKGHLVAKFVKAFHFLRNGSQNVDEFAETLTDIALNGGDRFLMYQYALFLDGGLHGFPLYPSEAARFREIATTLPFCDSSFLYYLGNCNFHDEPENQLKNNSNEHPSENPLPVSHKDSREHPNENLSHPCTLR